MNPKFIELLKKKKAQGKELRPIEAKAKGDVINDLMSEMGGSAVDKLKGLKKVTVASDSPEGMQKGLKMAEKVVKKSPSMIEDEVMKEEGSEHEMSESEDEESSEHEYAEHEDRDSTILELKKQIEELKQKLDMLA
jgi:hypothetical protein